MQKPKDLFRSSERAVTMVEMAILMPLLLLLALAITEFTFWLTANNLANTAAQRAASALAAGPDVDNACDTCRFAVGSTECTAEISDCLARRLEQIRDARLVAHGLVENTPFFSNNQAAKDRVKSYLPTAADEEAPGGDDFNEDGDLPEGVDINLPTPQAGQTLKTAFQNEPIQVTVRAKRVSFFPWFGDVQVVGRARAWKEPSVIRSNPARLDCAGNIIIDPGTAITANCGCATDPDDPFKIAKPGAPNQCSCVGNRVAQGGTDVSLQGVECGCPSLDYVDNGQPNCQCRPCRGTQLPNCGCQKCPDKTQFNGVNGCQPCICPQGQVDRGSTGGVCDVIYCEDCEGNTVPDGANNCVCPSAQALGCTPDKYVALDPQTKTCSCTSCPEPDQHPNADQTACECDIHDLTVRCGNYIPDTDTCTCSNNTCLGNLRPNPVDGNCRCLPNLAPDVCKTSILYDTILCECKPCVDGSPNAAHNACICDHTPDFCLGLGQIQDVTCSCISCTNGAVPGPDGLGCTCPRCPTDNGIVTGIGPDGKISCGCTPCVNEQIVGQDGKCTCPTGPAALAACPNGHLNAACVCQPCLSGQTPNNQGVCACPAGFHCDPPLQVSTNPATPCACECANGTELRTCFEDPTRQGCVVVADACNRPGPDDCECDDHGNHER